MKVEKNGQIIVRMTKEEAQEIYSSIDEIKTARNGMINELLNELSNKLK